MKKSILLISSLVLAMAGFLSCSQNENEGYNETAVLSVVSSAGDEVVGALLGNSKTVSLRAAAATVAGEPLKISFRVDESLVATYNQANGTAYEMAPASCYNLGSDEVIMPRYGKSSSTATLTFTAREEMPMDVKYLLPVVIDKVSGYDNYTVSDPVYILVSHMSPVKGMGTEQFPYLISEPKDLVNMHDQVKLGQKVWFKMTDDVDMSDITDWVPVNYADPFTREIDFDGNGHTISNFSCSYRSYPSFFGVLYGTVRNVTFLNPYINGGSAAGVIGGYIGTKTLYAHVSGVRVIRARIYETGTYGVGGIGGRLGGPDCVIENCYVNGQIESTYKDGAAGLIGGENGTATVTIRNCFTEGSVKAKLTAGGILGEFWRPDAGIYNCTQPDILSSAPMLIDNNETVGEVYAKTDLTYDQLITLNSEDLLRHQGIRHPRTAIAKTADSHILLITVDGRREDKSEGMTAKELTIFLKNWFKPQYALNLDGGGSTTMCVKGQGDPATHVVNYPTDNGQFDHAGERARDTHICIVPR